MRLTWKLDGHTKKGVLERLLSGELLHESSLINLVTLMAEFVFTAIYSTSQLPYVLFWNNTKISFGWIKRAYTSRAKNAQINRRKLHNNYVFMYIYVLYLHVGCRYLLTIGIRYARSTRIIPSYYIM